MLIETKGLERILLILKVNLKNENLEKKCQIFRAFSASIFGYRYDHAV